MSLWTRIRDVLRPEPPQARPRAPRRRRVLRRIADVFRGAPEPEYEREPREPVRRRPIEREAPERDGAQNTQQALIDLGLSDALASDLADVIDLVLRTSPT